MKTVFAVIAGLLVLPLTAIMVVLGGIVLGTCWLFGVPLTIKRGSQETKYRWFTQVK